MDMVTAFIKSPIKEAFRINKMGRKFIYNGGGFRKVYPDGSYDIINKIHFSNELYGFNDWEPST